MQQRAVDPRIHGYARRISHGRLLHARLFHGNLPPLAYTPDAMYTQFNPFPRVEQAITQQRNLLDGYDPNRRMGLFLDEWGVWDRMTADDEKNNGRLWQQES